MDFLRTPLMMAAGGGRGVGGEVRRRRGLWKSGEWRRLLPGRDHLSVIVDQHLIRPQWPPFAKEKKSVATYIHLTKAVLVPLSPPLKSTRE